MDVTSFAAAYSGAQMSRLQLAAAAKMMRMNADAQGAIVKVLEAAQQNMQTVAATAAGIGENLDILV